MAILKTLLITALSVPVVTLAGALALIVSQPPQLRPEGSAQGGAGTGLAFGGVTLPADPAPLTAFATRDGSTIGLRRYDSTDPGAPLLILLHGSGWHGLQYDTLGRRLAAEGLATVLSPDLRGHGPTPGRRGDADRTGQVEDDIADLILAHRRPGQEVILGGMSLGGGTVIRFAGGPHRDLMDRAVLMAPFLYQDAPTTRPNSGGWAQPLLRRFIGLTILNRFGITALNHLTVLQFRFPAFVLDGPAGATVTPNYSWTLYYALTPPPRLARRYRPPAPVPAARRNRGRGLCRRRLRGDDGPPESGRTLPADRWAGASGHRRCAGNLRHPGRMAQGRGRLTGSATAPSPPAPP